MRKNFIKYKPNSSNKYEKFWSFNIGDKIDFLPFDLPCDGDFSSKNKFSGIFQSRGKFFLFDTIIARVKPGNVAYRVIEISDQTKKYTNNHSSQILFMYNTLLQNNYWEILEHGGYKDNPNKWIDIKQYSLDKIWGGLYPLFKRSDDAYVSIVDIQKFEIDHIEKFGLKTDTKLNRHFLLSEIL